MCWRPITSAPGMPKTFLIRFIRPPFCARWWEFFCWRRAACWQGRFDAAAHQGGADGRRRAVSAHLLSRNAGAEYLQFWQRGVQRRGGYPPAAALSLCRRCGQHRAEPVFCHRLRHGCGGGGHCHHYFTVSFRRAGAPGAVSQPGALCPAALCPSPEWKPQQGHPERQYPGGTAKRHLRAGQSFYPDGRELL